LHPNEISYRIIGTALQIHQDLGPGLLESVYHKALQRKLIKRGLFVESNKESRLRTMTNGMNPD
jgi:GxxExxY protein